MALPDASPDARARDRTGQPDRRRPASPTRRFLFHLTTAGVRLVTLPLARSVERTDLLPERPFIVVANHRSLLDGILVVNEFNRVLRRPVHMLTIEPPFRHPFFGRILRISGCIPIPGHSEAARTRTLETALGFLRDGEVVGVFPEAHLSRGNRMRRGRPGAAALALESGVPVVPVGIRGSERILRPGTQQFRPGRRATLRIGFPLDFSRLRGEYTRRGLADRRLIVEETTGRIMAAVAALSGQTPPRTRGR